MLRVVVYTQSLLAYVMLLKRFRSYLIIRKAKARSPSFFGGVAYRML